MNASTRTPDRLLTLPRSPNLATSIRATAQVFEDPKSQALLEHLRQVAPSEASVLVIGETGTGKELVARHIHNLSARRNGPFVAVNCGAFSESLVEAELFGHEKGAFTGALAAKAGWFEEANGGTLFLDEIGDLPMPIQVKLLRVLQEREVVRLGSRKSIPIDVRVLAATNVQLERAINAGHFREDLYYRLNVVSLELSPLRERPGDILPLTRHFIAEYSRRLGYGQSQLSPEAAQKLRAYSWPGNIRELENVIHHTLLICRDGLIRADDLHLSNLRLERGEELARGGPASGAAEHLLQQAFQRLFEEQGENLHGRVEDALLRAAYRFCHGNQVHTANLLGLSRNVTQVSGIGRFHLAQSAEPDAPQSAESTAPDWVWANAAAPARRIVAGGWPNNRLRLSERLKSDRQPHRPLAAYRQAVEQRGFAPDEAQRRAAEALERCFQALHEPHRHGAIQGVYLWGPVGRGKTWLMDHFYQCLRVPARRQHFHHFMQWVHQRQFELTGTADPLRALARELARDVRVLCFDELFVSDIGDAILLGSLLRIMFEEGVVLVATSNQPPEQLYADGFNRERFLPAIEAIQRHMAVVAVDGGQDHRLHPGRAEQRYWVVEAGQASGHFIPRATWPSPSVAPSAGCARCSWHASAATAPASAAPPKRELRMAARAHPPARPRLSSRAGAAARPCLAPPGGPGTSAVPRCGW